MKGSRGGDGPVSERLEHGQRDGLLVAAIGVLSGGLYIVGHAAQRAVFINGQAANVAGEVVRGTPPDGDRLALELGVYWGVTAALFLLYTLILILCRRGALQDGRAALLALPSPRSSTSACSSGARTNPWTRSPTWRTALWAASA